MASDQTTLQAWMVAVPSMITAVSIWYQKKNAVKAEVQTQAVADNAVSVMGKRLDHVEQRLDGLESKHADTYKLMKEARDIQVQISMKHADTMNTVMDALSKPKDSESVSGPFGKIIKKP